MEVEVHDPHVVSTDTVVVGGRDCYQLAGMKVLTPFLPSLNVPWYRCWDTLLQSHEDESLASHLDFAAVGRNGTTIFSAFG